MPTGHVISQASNAGGVCYSLFQCTRDRCKKRQYKIRIFMVHAMERCWDCIVMYISWLYPFIELTIKFILGEF